MGHLYKDPISKESLSELLGVRTCTVSFGEGDTVPPVTSPVSKPFGQSACAVCLLFMPPCFYLLCVYLYFSNQDLYSRIAHGSSWTDLR